VKEDHRLPFVEFRAVFQGGVLAETKPTTASRNCSPACCIKGTNTPQREEIATAIESVGGHSTVMAATTVLASTPSVERADFATGLELVADVMLNPAFPEAQLEREREVQIAGIRSNKDDLLKSAFKAMRRELFGTQSYGLDSLGTEEAWPNWTAPRCARFTKNSPPRTIACSPSWRCATAEVKSAVGKGLRPHGSLQPAAPARTRNPRRNALRPPRHGDLRQETSGRRGRFSRQHHEAADR
jgi:zinc protease